MDTGLIKLSQDEKDFDITSPRSLDEILWIVDTLYKSLNSWLNGSSLPQTILSCIYVEKLLDNYSRSLKLSGASFIDEDDKVNEILSSQAEYQLVHKCLRSFILAICQFVRIMLTFCQLGIIIEEEDILLQTLDIDFLSFVNLGILRDEINNGIKWLEENKENFNDELAVEKSNLLLGMMKVILNLIHIGDFLSLSDPSNLLTETLTLITTIQTTENENLINNLKPVSGCFSMGVQLRHSNKTPPRPLVDDYNNETLIETFDPIKNIVNEIIEILQLPNFKSGIDILQFVEAFSMKRPLVSPFSRCFLQLYLLRENSTILGTSMTFLDFTIKVLSETTCSSRFLDNLLNSSNNAVLAKVNELIGNLTSAILASISITSYNPSRQYSGLSRQIVTWDSNQVVSEQLEVDLETNYHLSDPMKNGNGSLTSAMPISSFTFYWKLKTMISFVFQGFELDLYKPWEYTLMYWYGEYLIKVMLSNIARIDGYLQYRLDKMKKQKKKKAGKNTEESSKLTKGEIKERIRNSINFFKKEKLKYEGYMNLCTAQYLTAIVLEESDIIQRRASPFTTPNLQFGLRMKPFSSVGVPEFPSYDEYISSKQQVVAQKSHVNSLLLLITNLTKQSRASFEALQKMVLEEGSLNTDIKLISDHFNISIKEAIRSSIGIGLRSMQMGKILGSKEFKSSNYKIAYDTKDYDRSFPVIYLEKK